MNLTCCLERVARDNDIEKVVKEASENPLKGLRGCPEDQVSSCNFNSDSGAGFALISWCDKEYSYINRVVSLGTYMASKE